VVEPGKMKSTLSLLLVFLNHFFMPRHNAQLRLLKAQIAILRARIPTQRIILSPAEKAELLRIGAECGHEIDGLWRWPSPRPTGAGSPRGVPGPLSRPWDGRA
jgi:putative transposase